jgi:hypothetical protein
MKAVVGADDVAEALFRNMSPCELMQTSALLLMNLQTWDGVEEVWTETELELPRRSRIGRKRMRAIDAIMQGSAHELTSQGEYLEHISCEAGGHLPNGLRAQRRLPGRQHRRK